MDVKGKDIVALATITAAVILMLNGANCVVAICLLAVVTAYFGNGAVKKLMEKL